MTDDDDGTDIDGFFSTARVSGREAAVGLAGGSYRKFLQPLDSPKLAPYRGMDYQEFAEDRYTAPFLQDLLAYWESLYREPFRGITTDGTVIPGLYHLPAEDRAEPELAAAAERVLAALTDDERDRYRYPIDAPEWRAWSNPEFVVHRVGLRLEELAEDAVMAIHDLIRASLGASSYQVVREAMELNGFLGELVDLPTVMNDRSYWVSLFGDPSDRGPWGWQLFGHHVAVNFLTVGGRHVAAPVFLGAEPAVADDEKLPMFHRRKQLAVRLASSLTEEQRARAVAYRSVLDPAMPEGRLHPADERHVAGAFRDNRVVPYEGLVASELTDDQWALLCEVVADFVLLDDQQRALTLADVVAHRDETHFSWYGAVDGTEAFYFRIQSPVVLAELDHHAGIWLTNTLPAQFHVHTTFRLPNGNDYGRAYLDEWRERR